MPAAGTAYAPVAALPEEPVADAEALDAALPAAPVADVIRDEALDATLLATLLAPDKTLLSSLERLLRTEGSAVAATEEMLDTSEAAEASRELTAPAREDVMEVKSDEMALAMEVATDSIPLPRVPAALVTSPTADVTSETTLPMADVRSSN